MHFCPFARVARAYGATLCTKRLSLAQVGAARCQLAPEDLAFVARGCCRPLSARRDGRDLSYPFDHSNLLRMEARSTKSFSAMMCACSDSNGSLSAPRMALAKRSISLEGVG